MYRVFFKSAEFKLGYIGDTKLPYRDFDNINSAGEAAAAEHAILMLDLNHPGTAWAGEGVPDAYV